jgi:hypothetical protein
VPVESEAMLRFSDNKNKTNVQMIKEKIIASAFLLLRSSSLFFIIIIDLAKGFVKLFPVQKIMLPLSRVCTKIFFMWWNIQLRFPFFFSP